MRIFLSMILIFLLVGFAFGQNEQSPIVEKNFAYKDWTHKNVKGDGKTNLREFAKDKKLVMVVYWAPWCFNWKHDVAFVQGLHERYKDNGLAIIGVGGYDPVDRMKAHLDEYKISFPTVYDSNDRLQREKTVHYTQRREAGDTRKWGSPWYVFLEPNQLEKSGDVLTKKTIVVNGELIQPDAEKYIREKLGLTTEAAKTAAKKDMIEACEPEQKAAALVKP